MLGVGPRAEEIMRTLLTALIGVLAASRLKNAMLRGLGHRIDRTARIGSVFLWHATLHAGPRADVRGLSVFKGCTVHVGERAIIGSFNWVAADGALVEQSGTPERFLPELVLGESASLTGRHFVDVGGSVTIGRYTTVAGARSTFFTHGIDVVTDTMRLAPIVIGEFCVIGSNTNLVPGSTVPDRSVVAMGSTVTKALDQPGHLYAGAPARAVRPIDPHSLYFDIERRGGSAHPLPTEES